MRPLTDMPRKIAAAISCVFTDIDDTITTAGRLQARTYCAIERLNEANVKVVPVTGRPGGWCDMVARFWPVAGVVGENGAFYFAYDPEARKMIRVFAASQDDRAANSKKLARVRERVLLEVPGCAISADQPYREADLAVDFCEDVAPLPFHAVTRIKEIFEEEGAVAKISSIHVNGWYGNYDKLSMSRRFTRERLRMDLDEVKDNVVFCGDSPNDAPMFGYFPYSCGVANVLDFADRLEHAPAFVTVERGGEGFIEIADAILRAR